MFAPYGFTVSVDEHRISFTGASPRDFLDAEHAHHPLSVAAKGVLEARGELEALRQRLLAIFEAGNEDPHAFRTTRRYVIATARR
jgi:hypothetical protein